MSPDISKTEPSEFFGPQARQQKTKKKKKKKKGRSVSKMKIILIDS